MFNAQRLGGTWVIWGGIGVGVGVGVRVKVRES